MPNDRPFNLVSNYAPSGDQPEAIRQLVEGLQADMPAQTLLGVTGSGKTFTMANVIANVQRPALVIAHNKTLAAQLYNELKSFFPDNAVEYFISYYDYYQPEAYIPRTNTFIEKTASINDDIDKMRHSATRNLFERRDTIVVASVSCIYGLGLPDTYFEAAMRLVTGMVVERQTLIQELVRNQYKRNDLIISRCQFRVRGDVIDVYPAYEDVIIRLELFDDELERIRLIDVETESPLETLAEVVIYPAMHYVANRDFIEQACLTIERELQVRLAELRDMGKLIEAQRLEQRTWRDVEMIREVGHCNGIENYSRIFEGRQPGSAPKTLMDYFEKDYLVIIDESHVTIPQLRGMYHGDRSRKDVLIDYGFRLPCARDNRPLQFEEFLAKVGQQVFVSATPTQYELSLSGQVVEQIIRPTGLLDPVVTVRPTQHQVDDLYAEIRLRVAQQERVLITTLTKRMAEDLTEYLQSLNVQVRYLHSDIKPLERIEIVRDLRLGHFDVLVGVNLLREGLDLPEVTLVAIMDADKEGFLRSEQALIQTIGRAARNASGQVILYADKHTDSMNKALGETERRRAKQIAYNTAHGITPTTVSKSISNGLLDILGSDKDGGKGKAPQSLLEEAKQLDPGKLPDLLEELELDMRNAAKLLDFERAAQLRDQWMSLKQLVETGANPSIAQKTSSSKRTVKGKP
jgi:excinuclease ABC subunit B